MAQMILTYLFIVIALAATMQTWKMYRAERKKFEAQIKRFQKVKDLLASINSVDDSIEALKGIRGQWPFSDTARALVEQRAELHRQFVSLVGPHSRRDQQYILWLGQEVNLAHVSAK